MTSIHNANSMKVAREKGGFAGSPENAELWELPKRELIEALLHLAALCTESYDVALNGTGALNRAKEELAALRLNGII